VPVWLDIATGHGVHAVTFYACVHPIIDAISCIKDLAIVFPYNDKDKLQRMSDRFQQRFNNPLTGCAGAIDGLAIRIVRPKTDNSQSHYNRKGFFAVNMQAMCNANYEFTFVSCRTVGSTHDSLAFASTDLFDIVNDREKFPYPFWIAGDEAYAASGSLLTPWSGRNLETYKDSFNFHLSSLRVHIEQTFGIFVSRWGILWRELQVEYNRIGPLVNCLARLHNFCIQDSVSPYKHKDLAGPSSKTAPVFAQDKCDRDYALLFASAGQSSHARVQLSLF